MSDFMKGLISGEGLKDEDALKAQETLNEVLNQEIESSGGKLERVTEKWEPKEWRPEYQVIVTLSSLGLSGDKIAETMWEKYQYEITKQHISNILNCEKGKEARAKLLGNVVAKSELDVEAALEKATTLAANRIVELLNDDVTFKSHPFAVADRAIKVLEGRQKLRRDYPANAGAQIHTNNFINLPSSIQDRIERGMRNLARVEELHGTESDNGETKRSGTDG